MEVEFNELRLLGHGTLISQEDLYELILDCSVLARSGEASREDT